MADAHGQNNEAWWWHANQRRVGRLVAANEKPENNGKINTPAYPKTEKSRALLYTHPQSTYPKNNWPSLSSIVTARKKK